MLHSLTRNGAEAKVKTRLREIGWCETLETMSKRGGVENNRVITDRLLTCHQRLYSSLKLGFRFAFHFHFQERKRLFWNRNVDDSVLKKKMCVFHELDLGLVAEKNRELGTVKTVKDLGWIWKERWIWKFLSPGSRFFEVEALGWTSWELNLFSCL